MNSIEQITHAFIAHSLNYYQLTHEATPQIVIDLTTDPIKAQFGDITCNAPLVLAKVIGKNPRVIAQELAKTFKHTGVENIEVAGPGFINITLTPEVMQQTLIELYEADEQFFKLDTHAPRHNYSLEFVSANPTGPMHLGHGRNAIIGDVLGNILRFLGHTVIKEFYINDAGSQITKLGTSLRIRVEQLCGHDIPIPD